MIAPFPWHALPRVSSGEARAMRALAEAYGPSVRARAAAALSELLGQRVSIELRRRAQLALERVDLGARGALVQLEAHGPVVLEVDAELALAVVGAMAGRKSLPKVARGRAIPDEVAGALAGVAQWIARACGVDAFAEGALERPTPEGARQRFSASGHDRVIVLDLAVIVGTLRGALRVVTTAPTLGSAPARANGDVVLRALGDTPLSLAVVAASGWLAAREAARIGLGDVVIVDGLGRGGACVLAPVPSGGEEGGVAGISAERVGEGDAARVRIGARRVGLAPEPTSFERGPMSSGSGTEATVEIAAIEDGGPLVEALADAPVLVRVEVGSVTLPAREWAALGVGDVVALDRRVGDAVRLRIGGRVVARGELVDVDGALGVRVVERIA